jgi:hypothetical protein
LLCTIKVVPRTGCIWIIYVMKCKMFNNIILSSMSLCTVQSRTKCCYI